MFGALHDAGVAIGAQTIRSDRTAVTERICWRSLARAGNSSPRVTPIRAVYRAWMNLWEQALREHCRHDTFQPYDWAYSRQVGFGCECGNEEVEWWTSLSDLRRMQNDAWRAYSEVRRNRRSQARQPPDWIVPVWAQELEPYEVTQETARTKQERRRARMKAKALLHYSLTKEQRWDLRATKSFVITGKDGKQYRIREHQTVQLLVNGVPTHSLCVVSRNLDLPSYDLMLAQKLMLESNPEDFWKIANVTDLRPRAARPRTIPLPGVEVALPMVATG